MSTHPAMRETVEKLEIQDINRRRAIFMATRGFTELGQSGNTALEYMQWVAREIKVAADSTNSGAAWSQGGLIRDLRTPLIIDHDVFNDWLLVRGQFSEVGS